MATIKERRNAAGWTQKQLGEYAGMHEQTAGEIERGTYKGRNLENMTHLIENALDGSPVTPTSDECIRTRIHEKISVLNANIIRAREVIDRWNTSIVEYDDYIADKEIIIAEFQSVLGESS